MSTDLYAVLGLDSSASDGEIKRAYRKLARQYHPDVNTASDATERFNAVQQAYSILSDSKKKQAYDQYGVTDDQASQSSGFGGFGGFSGFSDFSGFENVESVFSSFFGGQSRGRQSGVTQGDSLRYNCTVSLNDVVNGCKKTISYSRLTVCNRCNGSGGQPGTGSSTCRSCNGAGEVRQVQQTMLGQFSQISTCPDCRGSGKKIDKRCLVCDGNGVERAKRTIDVSIPGGVTSGTKLRLSGEGDVGLGGGPSGDLYVFITVSDHPTFEREGDDLYSTLSIPVSDALLGTTVTVPTIEGESKLVIPEGTQPGTQFKLKDKGIKRLKRMGRGHQYVTVHVTIPKLSKKQKEAIKSIFD